MSDDTPRPPASPGTATTSRPPRQPRTGLTSTGVRDLPPETADGLTVSLFLAADRRIDMANLQRIA